MVDLLSSDLKSPTGQALPRQPEQGLIGDHLCNQVLELVRGLNVSAPMDAHQAFLQLTDALGALSERHANWLGGVSPLDFPTHLSKGLCGALKPKSSSNA